MIKLLVRCSLSVVVFVFVFLRTTNYELPTAYAADSTPSADIRTKLEELKKEIASKASKLKQEINRKLQNKAYVGVVKTKSSTSLTLASNTGPRLVSINQDTIFESKVKGKQKFSLKTLSEEDHIAALGDIDETGVLSAKKIILLPSPKKSPKIYIWGQIVSVSDRLITLKDRSLKNIALSLSSGTGVKVGQFIIATGTTNNSGIFEAEFIHVISQGGVLKTKKMATPSAQTSIKSASPSGKKK